MCRICRYSPKKHAHDQQKRIWPLKLTEYAENRQYRHPPIQERLVYSHLICMCMIVNVHICSIYSAYIYIYVAGTFWYNMTVPLASADTAICLPLGPFMKYSESLQPLQASFFPCPTQAALSLKFYAQLTLGIPATHALACTALWNRIFSTLFSSSKKRPSMVPESLAAESESKPNQIVILIQFWSK